MPRTVTIHERGDFYVPRFEVYIGGRSQPKSVVRDIQQVTFKEQAGEIDSFELTVNNWDADARTFKYTDSNQFDPGQPTEIWMGYYGDNQPFRCMLIGAITGLRPTFPASGLPTLAVTGLSDLQKFRKEPQTHVYENKTDSDIAKAIGGRVGVEVATKLGLREPRHKYLLQHNEFDLVFLINRAKQRGYDVVMKYDKRKPSLYFGPSENVEADVYKLTYGRSLIEFQPNLSTANQLGSVTVQGWDPVKKQKIQHTTRRTPFKADLGRFESGIAGKDELVTNPPVTTDNEAIELSRSLMSANQKEMVTATGSIVGFPLLQAGHFAQIDGIGKTFGGKYFLKSTTHTIGASGYTTQFECRLEG